MMDLTKKALPNTVTVDGRAYSIYTDFRRWMRFERDISHMRKGDYIEVSYLFKNDMPLYCPIDELLAFSRPQNLLPRQIGGSNVIVIDYDLDSDLIYAAILGQYGIDLMDVDELHWHKFLAMLRGLNNSTKLHEVMGYRCYEKQIDAQTDPYEELKLAWAIERISQEEQEELDEFSKTFER